MNNNPSYTIEEVSKLLKISKLTVYDLIKKEDLVAYKVGRQMRVDQQELERYKLKNRTGIVQEESDSSWEYKEYNKNQVVISGQDIVLDILSKYIEKHTSLIPLRSYNGSLNSLISMYNGECDVVSVHLYDGDTGEYNLPYVKRVLVNHPFILINLVSRTAGIYVKEGNPLNIKGWKDLAQSKVTIVNREKGSGARVLLDEQLRINGITADSLKGYNKELASHFSVASAVASGQADAGVGIENVAKMVNVDFIPMIKEQYDLVILKTKENQELHKVIIESINSNEFRSELEQLNGYDLSFTGKVIYKSF
ncbi:helix-turn-helix transcriptional regulator [Lysinibacillus telephonicus]|uniref:Helix-turn-helix domain-containing protein n=1 Tax=Lysinibacillus telephonicus TaxID=1714840 RepID=A0A3S0HMV7_9BACI|nr:helix-turn-helix transcriptional regulator [Lysinibacillus telephonicus]RTQ93418.1 helix-turn-helix domain-containing protein [Lysinibacillus telephonicus]